MKLKLATKVEVKDLPASRLMSEDDKKELMEFIDVQIAIESEFEIK